jgi:hypothetical protein
MRRGVLLVAVLSLLVVGTAIGEESGIEKLGWISGCWVSDNGKQRIEEQWMRPAGGSMIGMGRTVVDDKTHSTEFMQIREREGRIAYIVALEMGAKPVVFRLVKSSDGEAVFENPQHDFPQRIIYRRESPDALFARIEGDEKGVTKGIDFHYKRARCQ